MRVNRIAENDQVYTNLIPLLRLFTVAIMGPSAHLGAEEIVNYFIWLCFVDRCLAFYFWPLYCMSFFDLRLLITSFVSSETFNH